jgi:hypothetical protein
MFLGIKDYKNYKIKVIFSWNIQKQINQVHYHMFYL